MTIKTNDSSLPLTNSNKNSRLPYNSQQNTGQMSENHCKYLQQGVCCLSLRKSNRFYNCDQEESMYIPI